MIDTLIRPITAESCSAEVSWRRSPDFTIAGDIQPKLSNPFEAKLFSV